LCANRASRGKISTLLPIGDKSPFDRLRMSALLSREEFPCGGRLKKRWGRCTEIKFQTEKEAGNFPLDGEEKGKSALGDRTLCCKKGPPVLRAEESSPLLVKIGRRGGKEERRPFAHGKFKKGQERIFKTM